MFVPKTFGKNVLPKNFWQKKFNNKLLAEFFLKKLLKKISEKSLETKF
jgi:hypothetical protein